MYNAYFKKTELFQEKTGLGNKWLFFLAYVNPALSLLPKLFAIMLLLIFPNVEEFISPFMLAAFIIMALGDLFIHFALVSLKPAGLMFAVAIQVLHVVLGFLNFKLLGITAIENLVIVIPTLIYFRNRLALFGISTKEQPAIVLTKEDMTWGYSFVCWVGGQKGHVHLWADVLQADGPFLYGKQIEIPYEQLRVTHSPLLAKWDFYQNDTRLLDNIPLSPLTGLRLRSHLKKKGIVLQKTVEGEGR